MTEREPGGIERFLRPFVSDPTLWPVTIVLAAHAVLFGAVLLLFAVRDRSAWAALGLAALVAVSGERIARDLRARRFGLGSRLLAAGWILAGAAAWLAHRSGFV